MGLRIFVALLAPTLTGACSADEEHPPVWSAPRERGLGEGVSPGVNPGSGSSGSGGSGGDDANHGGGVDYLEEAVCDAPATGMCIVTEAGHGVGGGQEVTVGGEKLVFQQDDGVQLYFGDGEADGWSVRLGPDLDQYFDPGIYDDRELFIPGVFDLSAFGRVCGSSAADFRVKEIESDPFGKITRFSANFIHLCDGGFADGALNFNAGGGIDSPPTDPSDCAVAEPVGFCYSSKNLFPAKGRRVNVSDQNASIAVRREGGLVVVEVEAERDWVFRFAGPGGDPLGVGKHDGASTTLADGTSFFATSWCAAAEADFEVFALEPAGDTDAEVSRFDLDFALKSCDDHVSGFNAKLRYSKP